ncbi:MAG TPA: hypothetical protein PK566_18270 [Pseudobacteroides sp.]|nr:hypothetical protein [Pseudobacteroides sp.]
MHPKFYKKSPEERQDIIWDIELPPDSTKNDKLGAKVGNIINKVGGVLDSGIAAVNNVVNGIKTIKQAKTLGEKQAVAVGASNAIIKTMLIEPSAAIKYVGDAWFVGKDYADSQYNRYMENAKELEIITNDLAIAKDSDRIDEMYYASSNITNIGLAVISIVEGGIALKNVLNKVGSIRPSGNAPSLATAGTNKPFKPTWIDDVVEQNSNVHQVKAGVNGKGNGNAGVGGADDAVEITLRHKEGMPINEFNQKANALKELGDKGLLYKAPNPVVRDPSVTRAYRQDMIKRIWKQYGKNNPEFANKLIDRVTKKMQPDHVWELQLGGPDTASNLKFLDSFTNWDIGTQQIRQQIKNLDDFTKIKIKIEER